MEQHKWCTELLNMDSSNNLEACKSVCMSNVICHAINYRKTGGCSLRTCPNPVRMIESLSEKHEPGYVGYYKLPGIKILVC